MKLRNTAIALGIGTATALGLSLLKASKPIIVGSTAVVATEPPILCFQTPRTQPEQYQIHLPTMVKQNYELA